MRSSGQRPMSSSAGTLEVETADARRAHRVQREAVLVPGVDELLRGGRGVGEDAQPREGISEVELGQHAVGDRRTADPVEAVAAGDEVADELLAPEGDPRPVGLEVVDGDVGGLEAQGRAARQPGGDEVLDDVLLPVDRDRPSGELGHRDVVRLAAAAQEDAVVHEALAVQALGDPELAQQFHGVLLEHARAHALLDVLALARLEHDRLDAVPLQTQREGEPRGARADDPDLRPHQPVQ